MKKLVKYLPLYILNEIRGMEDVNEIRIKRNCRVVVKRNDAMLILNSKVGSEDFDLIIDKLLDHSYHSKLSEILMGYISLGEGYRCGIAGQAVTDQGKLTNLSEIFSVSIRIPRMLRGVCEPVISYLRSSDYRKGVLIYSPPGIGKTTLIRDLAIRLSDVPICKRVALIDSRKEVYLPEMERYSLLDVYSGYPKKVGIECAIRSMSPQIIICDEIGNSAETEAILENISAGVPIIATAHGSEMNELIKRKNIFMLYESRVFGAFVGIDRKGNNRKYEFKLEEV